MKSHSEVPYRHSVLVLREMNKNQKLVIFLKSCFMVMKAIDSLLINQ